MIAPYVRDRIGYAAYVCECSNHYVNITEENVFFFLQILNSGEIEESYKKEVSLKLVQFYYDADRIRNWTNILRRWNRLCSDRKNEGR